MNNRDKTFSESIIAISGICIMILVITVLTNKVDVGVGFIGSILGGLIGGFFTLMGVRRTIDLQESEKAFNELPNKILTLEELMEHLTEIEEKVYEWRRNIYHIKSPSKLRSDLTNMNEYLISKGMELRKFAIHVNGEIFREISEFFIHENGVSSLGYYISIYEGDRSVLNDLVDITKRKSYYFNTPEDYRNEVKELVEIALLDEITVQWLQDKMHEKIGGIISKIEDIDELLYIHQMRYQEQLR